MLRTRLLAALPYHVITRPISTMANPPRFHPLSPSAPPSSAPKLQGIIFDMDGTLTLPQPWMFSRMRTALGIPDGADILAHVAAIPGDQERADAMALVETVECEAMHGMKPSPGVKELMEYLDTRGIRRAVLTRNYEAPVRYLLEHHLQGVKFEPVVTRSFQPPKPDPAAVRFIAERWGLDGTRGVLMVGDSVDDVEAGRRAGAVTCLLRNVGNGGVKGADWEVDGLGELVEGLEGGWGVVEA